MRIFDPIHPIRSERLQQYIKHLPGLAAYYPMNEVDGSTAHNRAPATLGTLNGTITSVTLGQQGKVGRAYLFNGSSNVITLPSVTVKGRALVSIGAIIKVTDSPNNKQIYMESVDSAVNLTRLGFSLNTGEQLGLGGRSNDAEAGQGVTSTSVLSAGYHFVGGTIDVANDTILLYDNGQLLTTTGTPSFAASAFKNTNPMGNPQIGAQQTNTTPSYQNWYNDQIQHFFLVFDRLLTGEWLKLARIAGLA